MSLASYVAFIASNRRFVVFGFLMTFASSFGQTYFIGIFGPAVQAEFALSHTAWGTIYMIGTLASAAILPWSGKYIDRIDLRQYTSIVCVFIAFACLFMSQVSSAIMLVVAIFLLRHSGQGLMSHT
ncbi:MAG: MFS transporter, partial [Acidiferrobacterales bacterium]